MSERVGEAVLALDRFTFSAYWLPLPPFALSISRIASQRVFWCGWRIAVMQ
ncbi:MAG: hypothetical protein L3J22_05640 [Xanthomonadales bacterium]|nr:hypothetical protein [Xanthomonadales bacterium]